MKPVVSIIIRTKNEERWIKHCLESVFEQEYKNFEVILVDNMSTDGTIKKATQFPIKVVTIEKYLPGDSINTGIKASSGQYIVLLSGHCIPCDKNWLGNLVLAVEDKKIAGAYGRQLPMSFTAANDRRDLLITFGLDEKVQKKDCFFHNANSIIKKEVWDKYPFDGTTTNIEDRLWAVEVLNAGYFLKYTPDAKVYHHHGIHHGGSEERALSTLKVIERITNSSEHSAPGNFDPKKMEINCLIPFKGNVFESFQKILLKRTIDYAKNCDLIKRVVVLTESKEVMAFSIEAGAEVPFLRDPSMSKDYIDLSMLYETYINRLEENGIHTDLVVSLEPNYLLRPENLLTELITELLEKGHDTMVPTFEQFNATWDSNSGKRLDDGDIPRANKNALHMTDKGLALITYPELLRAGKLYGQKIGRKILKNSFSKVEIRSKEDFEYFKSFTRTLAELDQVDKN